jgi:hypothetical protein
MKNLLRLILLLAIVAIGIWAWTNFFPNPREAVRQRLQKVARLASFPPDQGNFNRAFAIQKLGLLFADDVQVRVDIPGYDPYTFNGRAELMQAFALAKRLGNGLKAEFLDMNIDMGSGDTSAIVDLTLKAKIGGESDLIAQELKITMKLIKGDWLVTRIETVKTLKP